MNLTPYQQHVYTIILQQIQNGTTFNTLVTQTLSYLRKTGDSTQGQVDRMDIRYAIIRLAIYGAININDRVITHNLDSDQSIREYLQKL